MLLLFFSFSGVAQSSQSSEKLARIALEITLILNPNFTEDPDNDVGSIEFNEQVNEWIWLMENPIRPDQFTRERLSLIPFLDKDQIERILVISSQSTIRSWNEFLNIEGLNQVYPEYLVYFFDFSSSPTPQKRNRFRKSTTSPPTQIELLSRLRLTHLNSYEGNLKSPNTMNTFTSPLYSPSVRSQINSKGDQWQFSVLSDKEEALSYRELGIGSITSWNLYFRPRANTYLMIGDFRVRSGSGVILSQSSGTSSSVESSRTISYLAKPTLSTSPSGILRGFAMGFPLGEIFKLDLFITPTGLRNGISENTRQQSPNHGIRVIADGEKYGIQFAVIQLESMRWGGSIGVQSLFPMNNTFSRKSSIVLDGEWSMVSSKTRSHLDWTTLYQIQSTFSWNRDLKIQIGYREQSPGFEWSAGSHRSVFYSDEKERHHWFQLRATRYRDNWPQWTRLAVTKLYFTSLTTSPLHPVPLNKEKTTLSIELRNRIRQTLTFQSTWKQDNHLVLHINKPGGELWLISHLYEMKNSAQFEHRFQSGLYNRVRIQHTLSKNSSTNQKWEQGFILDQSLHIPYRNWFLKWKGSFYRTGLYTSGRLVEEHLYNSFSSVYAGGIGNIQSIQLHYETTSISRNKDWNSVSIWMQISRHERLRNSSTNGGSLLPDPVQIRITLQTRIRF